MAASNQYTFTTHWRVPGTCQEIYDLLSDAPALRRWWPSVYLDVVVVDDGAAVKPGGEEGVGRVVRLYTKGWLPYTLRWQFRVTESAPPHGFSLEAWGDFVGQGVWRFTQEGDQVAIRYEWTVLADKPLLRRLSFLFKPLFAANHRWAMRQGERSLRLELARRRAGSEEERAQVPAPPGPTFLWAIRKA